MQYAGGGLGILGCRAIGKGWSGGWLNRNRHSLCRLGIKIVLETQLARLYAPTMPCLKNPSPHSLPDSEDRQRVLKGLRLPDETVLLGAVRRKRSCFTPRTRNECIVDFASKIKPIESGCWLWTGSKQHYGHGLVRFERIVVRTHALALALFNGTEIQDQWVCHHCDNGWCVNPEHLYYGTPQSNADDRVARGRSNPVRGSMNNLAKLSENKVLEIRRDFKPFIVTYKILAARHGVTPRCIKAVLRFQNWNYDFAPIERREALALC